MELVLNDQTDWIEVKIYAPEYNNDLAEERRKKLLTKKLKTAQRMEIYTAATQGNYDDMVAIVEQKKYSILEEVSKTGFFWNAMHFASHYGKIRVLKYLIKQFENHPYKYEIYNLQTAEGKTPLFWWISSGDISTDIK